MRYRRPRLPLPGAAVAASAATCLVVTLTALARVSTVRCDPDSACLTVKDLQEGEAIPEAVHLFDRYGRPLADVAGPRRQALVPERIPERVAAAYVAVEDRRFWQHEGIDATGVARALVRNVSAGGLEEGASTIPMQLVRSLWAEELRSAGPWRRKLIEARLAPRLVDALGRERVLALYLNAIYMGDGVYGVEAASRHYFDVGAESLDDAQLATLVGMTRAPEHYHPRRHPEKARARRDVVLGVLAETEVLSAEEAEEARARPLSVVDEPASPRSSRSYATAAVMREIRLVAPELAGRSGLRVYTTLDTLVQQTAEEALRARLEAIEAGEHGPFTQTPDSAPLQGAAVALDPASGAVRAWVGGRDFVGSEFDRVEQARRQVGSLVKPFMVALAVERGVGVLDLVSSDTVSIEVLEGVWSPSDHVEAVQLPIREAMVRSSNRAAVHLGQWLGSDAVRTVGGRVGLEGPIPAVPATFLGAFEASLLEMAGAFAVFGTGGLRPEPYLVERIDGPDGETLWARPTRPRQRAMDAVTSYLVLDGLRDVVDRGTGRPARAFGYEGPAAGKTGTTDEARDAWFVGLTPGLVGGVWFGFDQPRPITPGGSGGSLAAAAWGDWMARLEQEGALAARGWRAPRGVELVRYDPATGVAYPLDCATGSFPTAAVATGSYATSSCPSGVIRWFESLWRALRPPEVEPPPPLTRRPGGN